MSKRKFIAGTLSAALIASSSVGSISSSLTASAASDTAGTIQAMSITDSEMTVQSENRYRTEAQKVELSSRANWEFDSKKGTYKCPSGKSKQSLNGKISTCALDRKTLSFLIQITNHDGTDTDEIINNSISLQVFNPSGGSNKNWTEPQGLEIRKDTGKSDSKTAVYSVKWDFISYYGNKDTDIKLQFLNGSFTDCDVSVSCVLSAADEGYIYSEVTDSKGQKIHLSIRKSTYLSDQQYDEWLMTLGRYISSLSDITGIEFRDIYICFDDPSVFMPSSQCDYITDDTGKNVGILIKYPDDTSQYHCRQIMDDYFDWGIMHEISHAYSYLNDITQSYAAYDSLGDEGLVNVRGIAAIQNCSELRSKNLILNGTVLDNYVHALSSSANADNNALQNCLFDQLYLYDKYANSFSEGWAVIEKIMLGDSIEMSSETLDTAIQFVKESGSCSYGGGGDSTLSFSTRTALRFINVLYYLCSNHPRYGSDQKAFRKFLGSYVGIDVLSHYCNQFLSVADRYDLPTVLYDVDGNNVFDRNDPQAVRDFAAGKITLSPEGVFQADFDKDGYVTGQDADEMEKQLTGEEHDAEAPRGQDAPEIEKKPENAEHEAAAPPEQNTVETEKKHRDNNFVRPHLQARG